MILPSDFDDDEHYRDFRPRMPKRQRIPPVVQLCREMMPDICTIGESVKAFPDDIKFLSDAIVNEFGQDAYFNDSLLSTLQAVVLEQPQKLPAIALLTLVVNKKHPEVGKQIINHFYGLLQTQLDLSVDPDHTFKPNETGVWNNMKLILRYLSILAPCIIPDDLITVYRQFFELVQFLIERSGGRERVPLAEEIYTSTLLNIPYLFYLPHNNIEEWKSKVERLVIYIEESISLIATPLDILDEYNSLSERPYERLELPQLALANVKRALLNNLEELTQLFPDWSYLVPEEAVDQAGNKDKYAEDEDEQAMNQDNVEAGLSSAHGFNEPLKFPDNEALYNFSDFRKLDNVGSVDKMWSQPRYTFNIYLPNEMVFFQTVLPLTTYAGHLMYDIIIDIVESLEFNRKEVARQVITLDVFFKSNLFAEPGEPISQLINLYEENPLASTFKIEDLAIQTILSLIFKLPSVSQPFAYFYTLLVEICQNSPKAIAPVFGRAFRFLYKNLDNLDFELKWRYLDWFSIQMSNFNFSWKWNEWEEDSRRFHNSFYCPKMTFIKNLIRKELRLTSTTVDVEESLTEEFLPYLDTNYITRDELTSYYQSFFNDSQHKVNVDHIKRTDIYFKNDSVPFRDICLTLLDWAHKQNGDRTVDELIMSINQLKTQFSDSIVDMDRLIITMVIQTVVDSGSRSLSHANKYINDLAADIKAVLDKSINLDDESKEHCIVESVLRYWNTDSQTGFLVLDAFKFAGLISNHAVLKFAFQEDERKMNLGLVDATAIETVFRTLSQLTISDPEDTREFAYVLEVLCKIMSDSINTLNVAMDQAIVLPQDNDNIELTPELTLTYEMSWRYANALSFTKSILRKYHNQYRLLKESFLNGIDGFVIHGPTKERLKCWFQELEMI